MLPRRVSRDSPLTTVSEKWAWSGSRDPVNFWALNTNSYKTAKDVNFKLGRCLSRDSPDMTLTNVFEKWAWFGSRDFVNFWALSANGPIWLKLRILQICVSVNKVPIGNEI